VQGKTTEGKEKGKTEIKMFYHLICHFHWHAEGWHGCCCGVFCPSAESCRRPGAKVSHQLQSLSIQKGSFLLETKQITNK